MNNEMEKDRAELAARLKQLDDEFNRIGNLQVLANDFVDAEKKGRAVECLDGLTVADLRDLQADVEEKLGSLTARDTEADAMERLLKEVECRIGAADDECRAPTDDGGKDGRVISSNESRIALTVLYGWDWEFGGLLHLPEGKTVMDLDMNGLYREWDAADRPDKSFSDWLCSQKGFSEEKNCGFAYICADDVLQAE